MLSLVALILCCGCSVFMVRAAWQQVSAGDGKADPLWERFLVEGLFPVLVALPIAAMVLWGGVDLGKGSVAPFTILATIGLLSAGVCGVGDQGLPRDTPLVWLRSVSSLWIVGGSLLLLVIAGRLSIAVGQASFAAAIVLFWVNTPDSPGSTSSEPEAVVRPSILPAIGVVGVQVMCIWLVGSWWQPVLAGVLLLQAVLTVVVMATGPKGGLTGLRFGAWVGAYGVLLCLGMLSMRVVVMGTVGAIWGDPNLAGLATTGAGRGFEKIGHEAGVLAGIPLLVAGIFWGGRTGRRAVGWIAIVGALGLVVLRLRG